jgi:hypothetical protein
MKYVTDSYRENNLRKLADYLLKLPENYKGFDMGTFLCVSEEDYYELEELVQDYGLYNKAFYECGTVGCAIGHGPLAGIPMNEVESVGLWAGYSYRTLVQVGKKWDWCFSADWAQVDNTPQGAAKRILWLLDKGLPDNVDEQMGGADELCYV